MTRLSHAIERDSRRRRTWSRGGQSWPLPTWRDVGVLLLACALGIVLVLGAIALGANG